MKYFNSNYKIAIIAFLIICFVNSSALYCKEAVASPYKANLTLSKNQERVNWEWWENFNDITLLNTLKASVDNNFDILIADLKVEEALNYANSAEKNRAPFVTTGLGGIAGKASDYDFYGRERVISKREEQMLYLPLAFNYEFDFWKRKKYEREFWNKNKSLAEFEKNFIIQSTVSQISSIYFNILKNEKLINLYEELLSLKKKKLEINNEKFKLRLIEKQKIIELTKELMPVERGLNDLKAKNEELKNRFYFLVFGNRERTQVTFKNLDKIEPFYTKTLEISSSKVANRPDILMAEEQIRMAKLDVKITRKSFFPKIILSGNIYQISRLLNSLLRSESQMYKVEAGIFFDFFKKGKNHAELRAKKNLYKKALKEYEKTIVSSINDVNNSLFYLKNSLKNYDKAKENSKLDKENLNIEKEKMAMRLTASDEYIEAKEQFIKAKIEESLSKTECLIHTISLYKALGGNV